MAPSTHLFFNTGKNLKETVEDMEKLMCLSFHQEPSDQAAYVACGCMMDLMLRNDHEFEEDQGIPFHKYAYWLCFDCVYRNQYPDDEQMRQATARLAYALITERMGYSAMLVEDLQRLVAIHEGLTDPQLRSGR